MAKYLDTIHEIHFEITSNCNANCVSCIRQVYDQEQRVYNHNPLVPKNNHLDKDIFKALIQDLPDIKRLTFCGNISDPMMHPKLDEFLDMIKDKQITIHTNGSLRNKEFWKNISKYFQNGSTIQFSIDGLKDTNHLYRRDTNFDKILENAKEFIDHGGTAIWKFVEFPYNKHQIKEAKQLAKQMGFKYFKVITDTCPDRGTPEDFVFDKNFIMKQRYKHTISELKKHKQDVYADRQISCKTQQNKSIFVDFKGDVFPCCWIGISEFSPSNFDYSEYEILKEKYGEHFNSLFHYEIHEILNNEWYGNDLVNSWTNNPIRRCLKQCGKPYKRIKSWEQINEK